jgi:allantoinase
VQTPIDIQNDLLFKNKVSPYVGKELKGKVLETWLKGERVWSIGHGAQTKGQRL